MSKEKPWKVTVDETTGIEVVEAPAIIKFSRDPHGEVIQGDDDNQIKVEIGEGALVLDGMAGSILDMVTSVNIAFEAAPDEDIDENVLPVPVAKAPKFLGNNTLLTMPTATPTLPFTSPC